MAEYCSDCCSNYGMKADINIFRIALRLRRGQKIDFVCEGCENRGLLKDDRGKLFLLKQEGKDIVMHPTNLKNLLLGDR